MDPNIVIAGIAAAVLFAIAGIVGWADLCHQRRVAKLNAAIVRNANTAETVPINAAPGWILAGLRRVGSGRMTRPVRGRWS
jgi:hypothetical protein